MFNLIKRLLDRATSGGGAVLENPGGGGGGTVAQVVADAGEKILDRQKTLVDRLVHLLSVGYALPVAELIAGKRANAQADNSLVR